jgi:hypothetical protein
MTDNEFDDLNEEAMEAPKAEVVKKKVTKKKAVKKVTKAVEAVEVVEVDKEDKVFDIMFANAVKVGVHQKNYFANDIFDITIRGNVIELRAKRAEPGTASVFTTLFNVIHWRMESK